MPLFLALIFAFFAVSAHADDSCIPYLECKPLVTKAVSGPVGTHLFWFVRNEAGGIDFHGFSCLPAACDLQKLMAVGNQVLTGKVTPQAAWAEHMGFECDYSFWEEKAGEAPICRERKVALLTQRDAWLEGIPRQIVMWRVKPNGAETTRPVRPLLNGVLQPQIIGRAPVGAPCVVTGTFLQSGADRWMQYWNNGNLRPVVLCERVQP